MKKHSYSLYIDIYLMVSLLVSWVIQGYSIYIDMYNNIL